MKSLSTADPVPHIQNIHQVMQELTDHLREDIVKVKEPRAQALFETSAEVIQGLMKAFKDYEEGSEPAWRR